MPKLKVFVADDHPLVRSGLRALIDVQPDMVVIGESSDGVGIVDTVRELGAEVAVLDVAMPRMGGADATRELRSACPDVKVLALSAHEERSYVQQMLAAGASGYLVKRAAAEDLIRAIRSVAAGETYLDPAIAGGVVAGLVGPGGARDPVQASLSEREAEVLRLIAQGHAMKEIAAELRLGVRTVETYKSRAMDKVGLRSRADIVRFAVECGWLRGA